MEKSLISADDPATHANGVDIDSAKTAVTEPRGTYASSHAASEKEKPRTPGLKLFDVFLYPIVTNFSVFVISVAATYLTTRGGDRDGAGKLVYGKLGEFFHKRGEWLVQKFKSVGMTHHQADMSKMVFFSFIDGSLMAPVVKLVEDRRETIGCYIDRKLGTKVEDLSVYEKEPKQTWLSVLGGRFATAAIVVPTAVALDKTGLNCTLFNNPGKKVGGWLAKKPMVTKLFGKLDVQELSRVGFFEGFYTSVCTAGLYFSSRFIAKATGNHSHERHAAADTHGDARQEKHSPDNMHGVRPALAPSQEAKVAKVASEAPASKPVITRNTGTSTKATETLKRSRHIARSNGGYREQYRAEASQPTSYLGI